MAKVSHDKFIKSLVANVKELYMEADDNAIQIVLQQYDFNVEQTVQAFLDGAAEESLREWKSLGSGAKTTASKKKKKNKNKNSGQNQENSNSPQSVPVASDLAPDHHSLTCNGSIASTSSFVNGCHLSDPDIVKEQQHSRVPAYEPPQQPKTKAQPTRPKEDYKQMTKKVRDRTLSEASTSSAVDKPSKNPHAGLEKSCKDLQRQTVSLQRLKSVFNEQLEKSFKRISEVFKELHNQLNEREAQLIFDMDKAKTQAIDVMEDQQRKASQLKHQTDRAQVMRDAEVADLRTKIKLFVSERKHYEDLCQAQRFVCDFNHMLEEVKKFGEVVPVRTSPDHRRESAVSVGSSVGHEDVTTSPRKSSSTVPSLLASRTSSSSQYATTSVAAPLAAAPVTAAPLAAAPVTAAPLAAAPRAAAPRAAAPIAAAPRAAAPIAAAPRAAAPIAAAPVVIPNSAHVLMQSDSLTKYEAIEMAQRLANLTLNDSEQSSAPATVRSARSDRGRGSRGRGGGTSTGNTDRGTKPSSGEQQRDQQPAQGQGQPRGGTGRGRSNRGQGQTRNANESTSQRSGSASAQPSENNKSSNSTTSPRRSTSNQVAQPKSPDSRRPRGARQGGRRDSGQQAAGDASAKSEGTAKQEVVDGRHNSSGDAAKKPDAPQVSSSTPAEDGLTNGQVEALPQRSNRTNRRERGGGKQGEENQPTGADEPTLINGE